MNAISTEKQSVLTKEEAVRLLSYDPKSGVLRWRIGQGVARAGNIAGTVKSDGYRAIRINRRSYNAHRLAWLIAKGEWPAGDVDHRNGQRKDNRIENLRLATGSQNLANQGLRRTNTSRCKGVSWHRANKRWWASMNLGGRKRSLGFFRDLESACRAYCAAA